MVIHNGIFSNTPLLAICPLKWIKLPIMRPASRISSREDCAWIYNNPHNHKGNHTITPASTNPASLSLLNVFKIGVHRYLRINILKKNIDELQNNQLKIICKDQRRTSSMNIHRDLRVLWGWRKVIKGEREGQIKSKWSQNRQ